MIKVLCLFMVFTSILALEHSHLLQANGNYSVSTIQLEYAQAYAVCRKHGLIFASEKSAEETTEINAALNAVGAAGHYHWLAGVNITEGQFYDDSTWVWLDLGEEFNYTNWRSDEPSFSDNTCLIRYPVDTSPPARWATRACSNKIYFICQKP